MPTENHAMNFRSAGTIQDLVDALPADHRVRRPVLDKADLKGRYVFSFGWDSDAEFLSSLQAKLGLTVKAGEAQMDVVVIDHVRSQHQIDAGGFFCPPILNPRHPATNSPL